MFLVGYQWGIYNDETQISAFVAVFLSTLLGVILVSNYLVGQKWNGRNRIYIPECAVTMLFGLFVGMLIYVSYAGSSYELKHSLSFSSSVFFVGLLPPILFNEGYHMRLNLLGAYIMPIFVFAVFGVVISTFVQAIWTFTTQFTVGSGVDLTFSESVTFGGLLSATDPVAILAVFAALRVDPSLFYLVFGEAILNDAVALTVFNIGAKFVAGDEAAGKAWLAVLDFIVMLGGSTLLGAAIGCFAALALKYSDFTTMPTLEMAMYVMLAYLPFVVAQCVGLSPIVTILLTGITARQYAHPNLSSAKIQEFAEATFRVLSFLANNAVFLYLGMSVWGMQKATFSVVAFVLWTCLGCVVSRGVAIFGLSAVINLCAKYGSARPVSWRNQVVLWFAGLRGAIAFAAASTFPDDKGNRDVILSTTAGVVLIFNFVVAPFTQPLLKRLGVPLDVEYSDYVAPAPNAAVKFVDKLDKVHLQPFLLSTRAKATQLGESGDERAGDSASEEGLGMADGASGGEADGGGGEGEGGGKQDSAADGAAYDFGGAMHNRRGSQSRRQSRTDESDHGSRGTSPLQRRSLDSV